jgi:hypothetical protein
MDEFLFKVDALWLAAFLLGAQVLANVAGWHVARRLAAVRDEHADAPVNTIVGAVLGILALLLGFSFAMAVSRYDHRRQLVVEEANAIGTALLRTELLPEPHRTRLASDLARYVDVRLELAAGGIGADRASAAVTESERLHTAIWNEAVAATRAGADRHMAVIVLESLNVVIDAHGSRLAASLGRVPEPVLWLLFAVALISHAFVGYACGVSGKRHRVAGVVAAVLVSGVILLIVDIDRPRRGFVRVSQEPMRALQRQLASIPR